MIISTAEEMNPLRRSNMEDVHVVTELTTGSTRCASSSTKKHSDGETYTYLAIYDGHGGRDTVDFLQQALHVNVQEELRVEVAAASASAADGKENNPNNKATNNSHAATTGIPACLERALLVTDIQARQFGITSSGATVAICLIHTTTTTTTATNNATTTTLYTANVGDARIVHGTMLFDNTNRARRLSHDHSAQDPEEVDRITNDKGGFCFKGRVAGVLAVARSLGDFGLKEFVTAEPYTDVYESKSTMDDSDVDHQHQNEQEFVILACDGVWDVLTDQQAVDIVSHYRGNKQDVAAELTQHAIQRGTTDNITVVVCWL